MELVHSYKRENEAQKRLLSSVLNSAPNGQPVPYHTVDVQKKAKLTVQIPCITLNKVTTTHSNPSLTQLQAVYFIQLLGMFINHYTVEPRLSEHLGSWAHSDN